MATPNVLKPSYEAKRDEVLKLYIERKKIEDIGKAIGVSKNTAYKYVHRLISELGELTTARAKQIKEEFVVKSLAEIDIAKRVAMSKFNNEDSRIQLNAVNTIVGLFRAETEILTRLRVIESDNHQNIIVNNSAMPSVERLAELYMESVSENGKKTTD